MTDINDVMIVVAKFCKENGIEMNHISAMNEERNGYDISLTWIKNGHDGSKCKCLDNYTLPELEGVEEQLDRLTLRKQKEEIPDEDGEVPVKAKDIIEGDRLIYYGIDKSKQGQVCKVAKVANKGYYNTIEFDDGSTFNQVSPKDLRRKVDGA